MPKLPMIAAALLLAGPALAQEQPAPEPSSSVPEAAPSASAGEDLGAQVANPVASLISVPFQNNIDCCYGERGSVRYTLNVQPVVPVALGDDAQVIIRTILPFISQEGAVPGQRGATDFGDITQTFFFKPKDTGSLTWGVGPVFLWPVGGSGYGTGKWAVGPSALVLKQTRSGLTIGMLANHLWSYAGKADRPDISSTFLQPFFTKTFADTTSIGINTETSYDWKHKQWVVPLNLTLGRITRMGKQPLQIAATGRYYAESPMGGPEWGARLTLSFLFPE